MQYLFRYIRQCSSIWVMSCAQRDFLQLFPSYVVPFSVVQHANNHVLHLVGTTAHAGRNGTTTTTTTRAINITLDATTVMGWTPYLGDAMAGFSACAKFVLGHSAVVHLEPGEGMLLGLSVLQPTTPTSRGEVCDAPVGGVGIELGLRGRRCLRQSPPCIVITVAMQCGCTQQTTEAYFTAES